MRTVPFGYLVQKARVRLALSQQELADRVGLTRGRLSQIETLRRVADRDEKLRLGRFLGLVPFEEAPRRRLTLAHIYSAFCPHLPNSLADPDKRCWKRLLAVREHYPERFHSLVRGLQHRQDRADVIRYFNESEAHSRVEALHSMELLGLGAGPVRIAPLRIDLRCHSVVDKHGRVAGDRPHPALYLPPFIYFPQLRLKPKLIAYKVDMFVGIAGGREALWLPLEVDGAGHDPVYDPERTSDLGLPVVRVSEWRLRQPDYAAWLKEQLHKAHRKHRPAA